MKNLSTTLAEEATAAAVARATEAGNQEVVSNLVQHLRGHWSQAKDAKQKVEQDMLEAVRAKAWPPMGVPKST